VICELAALRKLSKRLMSIAKFPKGLLSEEQRAARAQALCSLGRFDEANEKLAGLAPQSPLAVQARQFCDARLTAR
jgi:hypothetical protein